MSVKVADHPSRDGIPGNALLGRVRDMVVAHVSSRLDELLTALDDDLFEHAEAARSDRVQQGFFDAMRVLRLERDLISARCSGILDGPDSGAEGATSLPEPPQGDFQARLDALSLLADDALEESLAVTTMSQRVERDCNLELTLLRARISQVMAGAASGSGSRRPDRPPLEPRTIAGAWAEATAPLQLDPDVRLVLNKRFEHSVMLDLGSLYAEMNRMLAGAGVLPDLNPAQAQRQSAGTSGSASRGRTPPPAPPASTEDGSAPAVPGQAPLPAEPGQVALADISHLPGLRQLRRFSASAPIAVQGQTTPGQPHPDLAGDPSAAGLEDASRVMSQLLVDIASAAQLRLVPMLAEHGLDTLPNRIDYGSLLTRGAARRGHDDARLDGADEDIVNLVQALFDQLFEDENLPVPMRALLARIQFPILRLALSDPEFIALADHPARGFLNLITHTGIGWARADESAQDRLYQVLESCVDEIALGHAAETEQIQALNERIRTALEEEEALVVRASERVVQKERERLEAEKTRRLVERLVDHRCAGIRDAELRGFLTGDWQQAMYRAHQRQGSRSIAWKNAFAVLRALTGSRDIEGAALLQALAEGLTALGRAPDAAQLQATRIIEQVARNDEQTSDTDAPDPQPALPPSRIEPGIDAMPDRHAMELAVALEVDDWIEIRRHDRCVRCRLASVTEPPERCIFLSRRGVRIDTLSRLELAAAIEGGDIRRLDTHQLFDNALASIIGRLREESSTISA